MRPARPLSNLLWSIAVALELSLGSHHAAEPRVTTVQKGLSYLDDRTTFHPNAQFPRLTTPQWFGEHGVEAVVLLSIDDMRASEKYESFLRPLLNRLKEIEGRAPVSVFCNALDGADPRLQSWLEEGLSLEVHTLAHPCPLLQKGSFQSAADNYFGSIDLLNRIPGNRPVAFRMPCCDSMSSPSPRFFLELFSRSSSLGQSLVIDSSVMNLVTTNDPSVPLDWILDESGANRFSKYLPLQTNRSTRVSMDGFQTLVENYPYPYQLPGGGWEFPCAVPSDWEAQNAQGTNHPQTVEDWKRALDIVVKKQGVFSLIFHPHGWIQSAQLVDLVNYASNRYGRKVRFLNFRDAAERLQKHLLDGAPHRIAGLTETGFRMLDLNGDGFMDLAMGRNDRRQTRIWRADEGRWHSFDFPLSLESTPARLGRPEATDRPVLLSLQPGTRGAWQLDGHTWRNAPELLQGLNLDPVTLGIPFDPNRGLRFRDLDRDGADELVFSSPQHSACWRWNREERRWQSLPFSIPSRSPLVNIHGRDGALRFVDLNGDGFSDLLYADGTNSSIDLFIATPKGHLGWERGWTFNVYQDNTGATNRLPPFVREGEYRDNGVWFRDGHLWIQNEDTAHLPAKVDRRSFRELLRTDASEPKSVPEALLAFRIAPELTIDCVAHEPMIVDPVAFDWDERGRLWVVEMRDYPTGMDGGGAPGGVIKILEDTDRDGRFDRASVFLEGLRFPSGVMPWRRGVLVTAAPDVLYAEDTDGDGKADLKKVLLTGFAEGNQQHRVNGFELGLDGLVYLANGDSGGSIRSTLTGQELELRGQDLRFDPDTGVMEGIEGPTQFGRRRDDWGNWFGNNNPNWLWHYFLPREAAGRNPANPSRSLQRMTPSDTNPNQVFAISTPQRRMNWPGLVNQVTSACSPTPYRDALFGTDFDTSVFISEPAHNTIHREVLSPSGASFSSRRAAGEKSREFLASTDAWFRPTMIRTGPDGALYVADMYRLVIEHPEYFPDELKRRPDLREGEDRGRIYRITPRGATQRPATQWSEPLTSDHTKGLSSSNGWVRDTSMRLLMHNSRTSLIVPVAARLPAPELLAKVREIATAHPNPKARLQSLHTLDVLRSLDSTTLLTALRDQHPAVQVGGLRVSNPAVFRGDLNDSNARHFDDILSKLTEHSDDFVRFHLALMLGRLPRPDAGKLLAALARRAAPGSDLRTAIQSSTASNLESFWSNLDDSARNEWRQHAVETAIASRRADLLPNLAPQDRSRPFATLEFLAACFDSIDRFATDWNQWREQAGPQALGFLKNLHVPRLEELLLDDQVDPIRRVQAILCVSRQPFTTELNPAKWTDLLLPVHPPSVRQAALNRLRRLDSDSIAMAILDRWNQVPSGEQSEVSRLFLERPTWAMALIEGIERKKVPLGQLDPDILRRLQRSSNAEIRERAGKLSPSTSSPSVAELSQQVTRQVGRSAEGAIHFQSLCASCHKLRGQGFSVGPDLGTVADKPLETLLQALIEPNAAIDARYAAWDVQTRDGRELNGILFQETAQALGLKFAGGREESIPRSQVQTVRKSALSLMPEGLIASMNAQQIADLVAFIRSQ